MSGLHVSRLEVLNVHVKITSLSKTALSTSSPTRPEPECWTQKRDPTRPEPDICCRYYSTINFLLINSTINERLFCDNKVTVIGGLRKVGVLESFTAKKEAIQPIKSMLALHGATQSVPLPRSIPVALQAYFLQVAIQFPLEVTNCFCFLHSCGQRVPSHYRLLHHTLRTVPIPGHHKGDIQALDTMWRPGRAGQQQLDSESQSIEGVLPKPLRSIQTVSQDSYGSSVILKIPVTRSAQKGEEPVSRNEASITSNLGPASQHRGQHLILAREAPWAKPHYEFNLEHVKFRGNDTSADTKELPYNQVTFQRGSVQTKHGKKDQGLSTSVDLKIPQVRGMDLSCETHATNHYNCSPLLMNSQIESALHRKLRVILPKQNLWHRKGVVSLVDGGHDSWGSDADQPTSSKQHATSDQEGDSKQPRKKRGRYRQYNSEILEEAIAVVMNGKMSVSKAQSTYGIPHSTLEYKVKERLGTLKNPPKKKLKLLSPEPQELDDELERSPSNSKVE
ncbi:ligand-dependent corepressor [Heterodontus francisci]|uniref:ligand-dependent corepressor n=1 Tax=Heterodontus francisci TaxID=7792 RepID=UPI00355C0273